jgi:predicted DNA-binding transcriptional regulator
MKKNITEILLFLYTKPRRWTEILEGFDISKATLSRYIKELNKKKILKKSLDVEGKIVYSLDQENISNVGLDDTFLNEIGNSIKKTIEDIQNLKKLGFFTDGLSENEILSFIGKEETLNLSSLSDFNSKIARILKDSNSAFKIRIRANLDVEKHIEGLKNRLSIIENLKNLKSIR